MAVTMRRTSDSTACEPAGDGVLRPDGDASVVKWAILQDFMPSTKAGGAFPHE
jgi:hypothetical protein